MSRLILPLGGIGADDRLSFGGKAVALANLQRAGFTVPDAVCISTAAYREFAAHNGLAERIALELGRKGDESMRWEEIWDASLRIHSMFLRATFPQSLEKTLRTNLQRHFARTPVVVRSSAPAEDAAKTSFAGLHESYLNLVGVDSILKHVKLVWASLWSDRAILYRRELNLDATNSTMAVLVQALVAGDCSGVVFSVSPNHPEQGVIEAVHGLNEGLVDGVVQPDRWIMQRQTGNIIRHEPPLERQAFQPAPQGTHLASLDPEHAAQPPLTPHEVARVWTMALHGEAHLTKPVDMEWTLEKQTLYTLQVRPITTATASETSDAERQWYLSLTRSFEDLKRLRKTIENEHLPAMQAEAEGMSRVQLDNLDNLDLADELERRQGRTEHWKRLYWRDCIPFAHGIRLFGQVYNDALQADDPHEFLDLLGEGSMISLRRNQLLADLAASAGLHPELLPNLEAAKLDRLPVTCRLQVEDFRREFAAMFELTAPGQPFESCLATLLAKLADMPPDACLRKTKTRHQRETAYIDAFPHEQKAYAADILDLARASYRLRDDDNVYLGRIEAEYRRACDEAKRRISIQTSETADTIPVTHLAHRLRSGHASPPAAPPGPSPTQTTANASPTNHSPRIQARQLLGQPAGPGLATATARVLTDTSQIFDFRQGEILVCDAVDPNMTFIVPLAKGIVERRGGMLIHGAIIAREYSLPCVTGVAGATERIRTGDTITVDGHLGIVTIAT